MLEVIYEDRRHTIKDVRRIHPGIWRALGWLLHHDDAPALTALSVEQFLTEKNVTAVPHPTLLPDLAPCVFLVFLKMRSQLKGRKFEDVVEIEAESQAVLKPEFQRCIQQ
jgi:hypothetical protein